MSDYKFDMGFVRGDAYFNVHADTAQEIDEATRAMFPVFKRFKDAVNKAWEQKAEDHAPPGGVPKCKDCGETMEYREGYSEKTHKKWAAYFCPKADQNDKSSHRPVWV